MLIAKGHRDAPVIAAILHEAERRKIPIETLPRQRLDDLSQGAVHQGCIAVVEARKYATLEQIIDYAHDRNEDPFLLILDAIQDVNNLGSLLRSAEAAGVHGVIIPMHRAAEVNATVVKTSAGASEHLLVAQETNLTRTIEWLKKQNIWGIGLDGEAKTDYDQADLKGALALGGGNEGKGISRLLSENCDLLIELPMRGHINSPISPVPAITALYHPMRHP